MNCNVPIDVEVGGVEVVVVVTEMYYSPEQKQTFHQEGLPAYAEPKNGYSFTKNGNEFVDFGKATDGENYKIVCDALLKHTKDISGRDYD